MYKLFIDSIIPTFKAGIVFILFFLAGCATEEISEEAQAEASMLPPIQNHSTRLTDNSLPTTVKFDNFKDAKFYFDPTSLSFIGNRLFLKLSRNEKEVLYLGEIDANSIFYINIQIRLDDSELHYELFTNNDNDITQFGVVKL